LGVEGAPRSQVLNFETALPNNRIGLGLNLGRNTIGITNNYNVGFSYAYRFQMGKGRLGLGLQGSIRSFNVNYGDERLVATEAISLDGSIPAGQQNKTNPNFGAGLYYKEDNFYIGFSVPRLLERNIDFSEDAAQISHSVRHFYLMGGYVFQVNDRIQIQPQVLFKYAENTPFDIDANVNFIFMRKYSFGATYRAGGSSVGFPAESVDILFNLQVSDQLLFGLAYDVTFSEIRNHTSGSIEAMLRYCFNKKTEKDKNSAGDYLNPRFF